MEKVRRAVKQIAYTPRFASLSPTQLFLFRLLSLASFLYSVILPLRRCLYRFDILAKHSVGNLTWGGNGKTPMVDYLARSLAHAGISPLILIRGYGGADMKLKCSRGNSRTSARIGVGANRAAIAATFMNKYGYVTFDGDSQKLFSESKTEVLSNSGRIGAAIIDDGMQAASECIARSRDCALMPLGNAHLLPLGSLREPLSALSRADIVVIHHADLVPEEDIVALEFTIQQVKKSIPIFFTEMAPAHFFPCRDISCMVSLRVIQHMTVLCLSGIGFADSFTQRIKKDIEIARTRPRAIESKFSSKAMVVVTEKASSMISYYLCSSLPFRSACLYQRRI